MPSKNHNSTLQSFSALVDFSNLINSSLDINFTLNNLLLTCLGKFQTSRGAISLINEDNLLEVKICKGILPNNLSELNFISPKNLEENEIFNSVLKSNKLVIYHELVSTGGTIGFIFLGERLDKTQYSFDDKQFLKTLVNLGSTAIENSLSVERLRIANRDLDSKVNQLSSLFDLSKEFSGILKIEMVGKLLVFSIIGQLMVSKFAVLICNNDKINILETKFPSDELNKIIKSCSILKQNNAIPEEEIEKNLPEFFALGVRLIIPMQIKGETKGLIILGKRNNNIAYTKSDVEFISSIGSLAIISIENALLFEETLEKQKMEKELETARSIQQNLLPSTLPQMDNFEIAAYTKTARQVGGDYYDVMRLDMGKILFAIGDVSGKGVQAALLMANLQAFLRSIWKQNNQLDQASNLINDLVSENTTMGSFITFFWGILNDVDKELVYVNAGHNPPLLLRNGKIIRLKKGGMILGVMETIVPYESEKISFESGDLLVMFTDGVTEAMNTKGEVFSDERLETLVLRLTENNPSEIIESIREAVDEFTMGADQSDDITALIIKVK